MNENSEAFIYEWNEPIKEAEDHAHDDTAGSHAQYRNQCYTGGHAVFQRRTGQASRRDDKLGSAHGHHGTCDYHGVCTGQWRCPAVSPSH